VCVCACVYARERPTGHSQPPSLVSAWSVRAWSACFKTDLYPAGIPLCRDCAYDCASEICFGNRVFSVYFVHRSQTLNDVGDSLSVETIGAIALLFQEAFRSAAIARTIVLPKSV